MPNRPKKAGLLSGLALSLFFGAVLTAIAVADLYLQREVQVGKPLQFTLRTPSLGVFKDTQAGGATFKTRRLIHARGSTLGAEDLILFQAYDEIRRPPHPTMVAGVGLGLTASMLLLFAFLRQSSAGVGALRTHFVVASGIVALGAVAKAGLLLTAWSPLWVPLGIIVAPTTHLLGRRAGIAAAACGAFVLAMVQPLDLQLLAVLLTRGAAMVAVTGSRLKEPPVVRSSFAAIVAGAITFTSLSLMLTGTVVIERWDAMLSSDWYGATGAGFVEGVAMLLAIPLFARGVGVPSSRRLVNLANLDSPLLKRVATHAPGTWAHSLNLANMAEMATNAIGGNGLLVRVGAYYHDIGKAAQADYFVENQERENPHDHLDPEVSADAIFSHVSDGVRLAKKHKLPYQIVRFIFSHHGNGLLEYFWDKNLKAGNQKGLTPSDFSYPGQPPQTREEAILSICDAVEAASRSIDDGGEAAIRNMVRRIVFTKLEGGMLDDSGLSLAELQKVMDSVVETLRSARHRRVKYPWQQRSDPPADAPAERRDPSPLPAAAAIQLPSAAEQPATAVPGDAPAGLVAQHALESGDRPVDRRSENSASASPSNVNATPSAVADGGDREQPGATDERPRTRTKPLGMRNDTEP